MTDDQLPRLIQGAMLGSLAYWLLRALLTATIASPNSSSWREPFLFVVVAGAGAVLAIRDSYRLLGLGLILAAVGWTLFFLIG
jgi:hypothetical protein